MKIGLQPIVKRCIIILVLGREDALKILIIEDERTLANSLKLYLTKKGFDVEAVYDGESGYEYASLGIYDLLIMDVMMPRLDGYELTRILRKKHLTSSILMLTAKSSVEDRIQGLNAGADYYLTKPFSMEELLACINALMRRVGTQVNQLKAGDTLLDLDSCQLICRERTIRLSAKEFDLARILFQAGRRVVSKEMLLSRMWGLESNAVENNVEVYVAFLRKKLQSIHSSAVITTIRGVGYCLEISQNDSETAN